MIEPLRFHSEKGTPFAVKHPLYCGSCLSKGRKGDDANVAVKFCTHCDVNYFQCLTCDEEIHRLGIARHHVRRTLVLGPGVRKQVITRGDALNFPLLFDEVHVKYSVKIYSDGKCVYKVPSKNVRYSSGLSGKCIHVQVLSAKDIIAGDINGTSDPFIVGMYSGKKIGSTRVRPRTLSPKWSNETFIVPVDDNLPPPRKLPRTQRDLFRLEVYDYDYFTRNDLLGHVELTKERLLNLAATSDQRPIRLYLNSRRFLGILGIQMGVDASHLHFRVCRAEALSKGNPNNLSNPYAKVWFGDILIGTTSVVYDTIDPEWLTNNTFKIKINDIIARETELKQNLSKAYIASFMRENAAPKDEFVNTFDFYPVQSQNDSKIDMYGTAIGTNDLSKESLRPRSASPSNINVSSKYDTNVFEPNIKLTPAELESTSLFRVELFHHNLYRDHVHLGTTNISIEYLRTMLPNFPVDMIQEPQPSLFSPIDVKSLSSKFGFQSGFSLSRTFFNRFNIKKVPFVNSLPAVVDDEVTERPKLPTPLNKAEYVDPVYSDMNKELLENAENHYTSHPSSRKHDPFIVKAGDLQITDLRESSKNHKPYNHVEQGMNELTDNIDVNDTESNVAASISLSVSKEKQSSLFRKQSRLYSYSDDKDDEYLPKNPIRHHKPPSGPPSPRLQGLSDSSDYKPSFLLHGSSIVGGSSFEDSHLDDLSYDENDEYLEQDNLLQNSDSDSDILLPRTGNNAGGKRKSMASSVLKNSVSFPKLKLSTNEEHVDLLVECRDENGHIQHQSHSSSPTIKVPTKRASILQSLYNMMPSRTSLLKPLQEDVKKVLPMSFHKQVEDVYKSVAVPGDESSVSWSFLRHFKVEKKEENTLDQDKDNRGYIVVRLIPSSRGQVITGLDQAVRRMSLGEKSSVLIRYDHAYGNFCVGAHIPPRANMVFKIQLLEINGMGKLELPLRILRRFQRFYKRSKNRAYAHYLYHVESKPWYNALCEFLRSIGILPPLKIEDQIKTVQKIDRKEITVKSDTSDDHTQASVEHSEKYNHIKTKKLVTKSAIVGTNYQWGYNPKPKKSSSKAQSEKLKSRMKSIEVINATRDEEEDDDYSSSDSEDDERKQLKLQRILASKKLPGKGPPLFSPSSNRTSWVANLLSPTSRRETIHRNDPSSLTSPVGRVNTSMRLMNNTMSLLSPQDGASTRTSVVNKPTKRVTINNSPTNL